MANSVRRRERFVGLSLHILVIGLWIQDNHRRRIKTEAKAKVVAAVWGAEFIPFLAVLAFVH